MTMEEAIILKFPVILQDIAFSPEIKKKSYGNLNCRKWIACLYNAHKHQIKVKAKK